MCFHYCFKLSTSWATRLSFPKTFVGLINFYFCIFKFVPTIIIATTKNCLCYQKFTINFVILALWRLSFHKFKFHSFHTQMTTTPNALTTIEKSKMISHQNSKTLKLGAGHHNKSFYNLISQFYRKLCVYVCVYICVFIYTEH